MEFIENKEEEHKQIVGIFKDILKYLPSKLVGTVGNAIVIPIYTSLLPPAQYGLYSLSIAFLSFLCIIFSDWVGLSGLRFFRQHQLSNDLSKYLSTLVCILGMNLFLMFLLCGIFHSDIIAFFKIPAKYFYAVLFLIIPVAVRALLFQLLRAQLKSVSYTFSTILNQFLTIGLSIFFIKVFHLGAVAMLLAMGISISIIDVILMVQSNILKYFKKPEIKCGILLPIILYGIPISATSLSAWMISQSNKFIMNHINGFTDVAFVGVAYGVTQPILMTIFATITVAVIPRILRMFEEKIDVRPIIAKFCGYYMLVAIPLVLIMAVYPQELTRILANSKFYDAYRIVPYFAIGTFFMGLTDYTTLQYHLANKTYIELVLKLISGLANVFLTIKFIPMYGLEGVGLATVSANALYFMLTALVVLPKYYTLLPLRQVLCIGVTLIPLKYLHSYLTNSGMTQTIQMIILFIAFYGVYYCVSKVVPKRKVKI